MSSSSSSSSSVSSSSSDEDSIISKSSSKSSSNSSSSDSSVSSIERKVIKKRNRFKVRRNEEKRLQKWIVTGIDEKNVKKSRERYVPCFKGNRVSLKVPELDESLYIRLKTIKKSTASKANIDSVEKAWRQFQYKIFDLGKPMLFLNSIKKGKSSKKTNDQVKKAGRCAMKLWSVLVREVNKIRRLNILHQTYPKYETLLNNTTILKDQNYLFGEVFLNKLVRHAATDQTLSAIDRKDASTDRITHRQRPIKFTPRFPNGGKFGNSNKGQGVRKI